MIENNGPYSHLISKRKCGHEGVEEFWWITSDIGAYGNEADGPLFDWITDHKDFMSQVKQFKTVVQAGGNCGMYPRFYANYFENVYTFEPCPVNYACLEINCAGDKYHKYFAGLGADRLNKTIINKNKSNVGAHTLSEAPGDTVMYTIDALNLEQCDLIHLDVEGYEPLALIGALETIRKFKPVIILEKKRGFNIIESEGYVEYKTGRMDTIFIPEN